MIEMDPCIKLDIIEDAFGHVLLDNNANHHVIKMTEISYALNRAYEEGMRTALMMVNEHLDEVTQCIHS